MWYTEVCCRKGRAKREKLHERNSVGEQNEEGTVQTNRGTGSKCKRWGGERDREVRDRDLLSPLGVGAGSNDR